MPNERRLTVTPDASRCPAFALATCVLALLVAGDTAAAEPEPTARPTIGLVLSGGGARGAAHVGVIRVLDELEIPVDYVAGTSMGAIVGGLYASGMSADELEAVIDTADWSELLSDRPPRAQRSFRRKSDDIGFLVDFDLGIDRSGLVFPGGLIQGQNLEIAIRHLTLPVITVDDFDALPIPFRAVATDIVTGEMVVFDSGDLPTAMHASMAVPGVFRPERYQGRILVDGGVANNLPIQVVRDMGADVVIAVDVGFPLLPEAELDSALAITKQMLTILINQRAEAQLSLLGADDILIRPELGDLESQEFQRLVEAKELGAQSAAALASTLARLSVPEAEYAEHRRRVAARRRAEPPVIDRIVVSNESRLSPRVIEARLTDQSGGKLDVEQLESDIADVYGFDTFEKVAYDIGEDGGRTALIVRGTAKRWGPNYLRFGINLEDDFDGGSNYNIAARLTRTEINPRGGELRAELQVGESPRLFAELYQPLDFASRWFVNPQIEFGRTSAGLFDDGKQIAEFRSSVRTLTLEGGRQIGNWGEIRVGVTRLRSSGSLRIGPPELPAGEGDLAALTASFGYDTIDRFSVPRFGTSFGLTWSGSRTDLGSDGDFDLAGLFLLKPQSWGKHTLLHWWNLDTTTRDDTAGVRPFTLGGLFNLSGYAADELDGAHAGMARLLYYRRLNEQNLPWLETPVYIGASLEAGNVWQRRGDIAFDTLRTAGSVFIVFDSLLGPLYLAYGAAEDGRRSAYLFLGQTF